MICTFLGCDWGTTAFRLRLIERGTRRVLDEQSDLTGIKAFAGRPPRERAAAMERFLMERIDAWAEAGPEAPIVVTGMASSNVGWCELPYAEAPFGLDGADAIVSQFTLPVVQGGKRNGLLVSGVRTSDDVMRGEESILIGAHLLDRNRPDDGKPVLYLLAGTHAKHATIISGKIARFRTYITGELFDVLTRHSLFAGSTTSIVRQETPTWEEFKAGVNHAKEWGLAASLFQVRARHMLLQTEKMANTWFLSGLLIGAELIDIVKCKPFPALCLIGDEPRLALYREALKALGYPQLEELTRSIVLSEAVVAGQEQILVRHEAALQR